MQSLQTNAMLIQAAQPPCTKGRSNLQLIFQSHPLHPGKASRISRSLEFGEVFRAESFVLQQGEAPRQASPRQFGQPPASPARSPPSGPPPGRAGPRRASASRRGKKDPLLAESQNGSPNRSRTLSPPQDFHIRRRRRRGRGNK